MTPRTPARLWLDRAENSIVVVCTCGWRDAADTTVDAWDRAARHAWAVHDYPTAKAISGTAATARRRARAARDKDRT